MSRSLPARVTATACLSAVLCAPAVARAQRAPEPAPRLVARADTSMSRRATAPAPDSVPAPVAPPHATEGFSSDRPGFTDGPVLLAPGTRQVESGYSFARLAGGRGHSLGEVLVRVGLHRLAELRVALNSYEFTLGPEGRATGLNDAVIATKVRLSSDAHPGPGGAQLALLVGSSVPTGSRSVAHDRPEPAAAVVSTWALPHASSLTVNLGTARRNTAVGRAGETMVGASIDHAFGEHLGGYVEYYRAEARAAKALAQYANVGVTLVPGERLQVDTWTAVGLHRGPPDYKVGIGLTRRF